MLDGENAMLHLSEFFCSQPNIGDGYCLPMVIQIVGPEDEWDIPTALLEVSLRDDHPL